MKIVISIPDGYENIAKKIKWVMFEDGEETILAAFPIKTAILSENILDREEEDIESGNIQLKVH
jgi:hypothetical protein